VVVLVPSYGVNVEELDGLVPLAAHLDQLALLKVETHIIRSVWPKKFNIQFKLRVWEYLVSFMFTSIVLVTS